MNMTFIYHIYTYKSLYDIKNEFNNISKYRYKILGIEKCYNQITKLAICVEP